MKPGNTGLTRIIKATKYSWQGLRAAWVNEAAFRQELILMIILTPCAFWFGRTLAEILLLLIMAWLIVIIEIINSAIEAVVDRFGDEWHELAGRAKDMGSAAVFLVLSLNAIGWGAVLIRDFFL